MQRGKPVLSCVAFGDDFQRTSCSWHPNPASGTNPALQEASGQNLPGLNTEPQPGPGSLDRASTRIPLHALSLNTQPSPAPCPAVLCQRSPCPPQCLSSGEDFSSSWCGVDWAGDKNREGFQAGPSSMGRWQGGGRRSPDSGMAGAGTRRSWGMAPASWGRHGPNAHHDVWVCGTTAPFGHASCSVEGSFGLL